MKDGKNWVTEVMFGHQEFSDNLRRKRRTEMTVVIRMTDSW